MSNVENELETLQRLPPQELRSRWQELLGQEPPKSISPQLMRLAIAYTLQEHACGGLSRQAMLRLKNLGKQSAKKAGAFDGTKRSNRLRASLQFKPGTRFLRERQGQTHEVIVLEDGRFVHGGRTHRSLTAIARAITGTHQSGPIFFGLVKRSDLKLQP